MRLTDFEIGEVWLMTDVVRLCKVVGKKTVDIQLLDEVRQQEALEVVSTIPAWPIEGLVDDDQAKENKQVLNHLKLQRDDHWRETWTERSTQRLQLNKRLNVWDRGGKWIAELYCFDEAGRRKRMNDFMSLRGKTIVGVKIPPELVPKAAFPEPKVKKEKHASVETHKEGQHVRAGAAVE